MNREVERDDIEALAKALCHAYETGIIKNSRDFNWEDNRNRAVEDKWHEWIPKAKELADKVYGNLLESCQLAYRKHVLEDDTIGWESLGSQLCNAIVETMGEEKYTEWLDKLETAK